MGSSPVFLDLVKMLLPAASSDVAAMRDLAEAVSNQADANSLPMLVAQLPNGSATVFNDGQTMLHVVVKAANEYFQVRCSYTGGFALSSLPGLRQTPCLSADDAAWTI